MFLLVPYVPRPSRSRVRAKRRSVAGAVAIAATMIVTLSGTAPAYGQWLWKDESGHLVASDQPPPIGTPPSRILKEPRARSNSAVKTVAAKDPPPPDAGKSLADRELESRQRQKESAEAAKKADDHAARARAMQENCTAVRGNLAGLQAGGRAARTNAAGEKVYIDDAQRQAEISKSQGQIAQYCK